MNDKASPLVKFHGVSYGDDRDLPVSALVKEFRHRFGPDDNFVRVLRLTRNVFDNLVARHHLARSENFAAPDIKPCMQ